jgi:hypothetical protein
MTAAATLDREFAAMVQQAGEHTGLSTSDLVRQGLLRVFAEIEQTGGLTCPPVNRKRAKTRPGLPGSFDDAMEARMTELPLAHRQPRPIDGRQRTKGGRP